MAMRETSQRPPLSIPEDMKVLRVWYTRHKLAHKHYHNSAESRDFDCETIPEAAYRQLLTEYGSIVDSKAEVTIFLTQRIKISPTEYITIHSSSVVEQNERKPLEPKERIYEVDLFPPLELKNCLSRDPSKRRK